MSKLNLKIQSAVALALGVVALGAEAGTLTVTNPIPGKVNNIATEVFGPGSDATSVYAPDVTYTVKAAVVANSRITFNLGNGATFASSITAANFFYNGAVLPATITVVNGGTAGSNFVTLATTAALAIDDVITLKLASSAPDIKVNNLKTALSSPGSVGIAVSITTDGGAAQDPTQAATLLASEQALGFSFSPFSSLNGVLQNNVGNNTINSADADKRFSLNNSTAPFFGSGSFTTPGQLFNHLGSIRVRLAAAANVINGVAAAQISQQDGTAFNVSGADKLAAGVTTVASLTGITSIYLDSANCAGTGFTGAATQRAGALGANGGNFNLNLGDLGTWFNVCLISGGTTAITPTAASGSFTATFFAPTYQGDSGSGSIASLRRNGITQTLPYILSPGNTYQTYARIVNTSTASGPVFLTGTKQDGTQVTAQLETSLPAGNAKLYSPADLAAVLGSAAPSLSTDFQYLQVFGGMKSMDAIQFMLNPNGTVTQFNTNNNQNN